MRTLLALLFAVTFASPAAAQKHCSKGKPCGRTCIARNKTCHVGSSALTGDYSTKLSTDPPTIYPRG